MTHSLVTGGCGFVGRHLVKRLLKQNRSVVVVDNLYSGQDPEEWLPKEFQSNLIFIKTDVRKFLNSDKGMKMEFDDVFHLSAVIGGRLKIDNDPITVAQDLSIDSEFFNWLVKKKPERTLYASSSAAYPTNLQQTDTNVRLKEDMISFNENLGIPDMTYGWAKLTGEHLSRLASKYYDLHIACVRPFSGYGEDQDNLYPIPAIGARAVNGKTRS